MNEKDIILECINATKRNLDKIHLYMLLNAKDRTTDYDDYLDSSITTEFLDLKELEELLDSVQNFGIYSTVYYDIHDFIRDTIENKFSCYDILFETTQKGIGQGKDALIPSLCDIMRLRHIGPSAVFNVITNDKYCWNKYLNAHGILTPTSWKYSHSSQKIIESFPPQGMKLICKPIYECASIGIDSKSIGYMDKDYIDVLKEKSNLYQQSLIIQQFIRGYEVEVPIISSPYGNIILPPVGIAINGQENLNDAFLGYDTIYDDMYEFYNFTEFSPNIAAQIRNVVHRIIPLLDFNSYARIDFRVETDTQHAYVTDINAYPHIVKHSSFAQSFQILGIDSTYIIPALVGRMFLDDNCT